jgi:hypothetical protein
MNKKSGTATILDYLIPLHITYLNEAIGLKRIGRRNKGINLYVINPITGIKEVAASILITVNIDSDFDHDYADLKFSINGKRYNQSIKLVAKNAPIGKGYVYYFKCCVTGKLRRKLFLHDGRFVSKLAIPNPHYLSQIQSRKERNASKNMKQIVKLQNTAKQGKKRYFKRYYDGNLTKRYMKILEATDSLQESW